MATSEMRGFVFAVIFIVAFGTILSSIPAGFQGTEASPDTVVPLDPALITGFAETTSYQKANFTAGSYEYPESGDFGGFDWICVTDDSSFSLARKIKFLGFFWFGQLDGCEFVAPDGTNRGTTLTFTEIATDAEDGAVRYSMDLIFSGDSAGSFVIYWNITAYPAIADAWTADELYLLHGLGLDDLATNNIGALIVSFLFFHLPDVPILVNLFLALPIWAGIAYILWFLITSMIPFIGG